MICVTGWMFSVLCVPPQARCSVLTHLGLQKGVGHAVAAWDCTWRQGSREWRPTWRGRTQTTRVGRLWVPVTFLCHQTQCTGKGGPSLPEWLQGSLRCHFLSQDDVNNVTFLQHLSVCMSVNTKPSKEWPSSSSFSSSSLFSSHQSTALVVHWASCSPLPFPILWESPGLGWGCTRRYRCRIGLLFLRLAQGTFRLEHHVQDSPAGQWYTRQAKAAYISSVACSGARILVPSFSLLQKSSSIWTPG